MDMEESSQIEEIEIVNPWADIWFHPRLTINWIWDNYNRLSLSLLLLYLGGVYYGIGQAEMKNFGDNMESSEIFVKAFLVSGLGGMITYNLLIGAIDICALWLGGKGNFRKTQMAFAWSMLPMVVALLLATIGYLLFGDELFASDTSGIDGNSTLTIALWTYGIIEIVLGAWHITLVVALISEVQKFSLVKSIISIVGGFLFLILPLFVLVMVLKML